VEAAKGKIRERNCESGSCEGKIRERNCESGSWKER